MATYKVTKEQLSEAIKITVRKTIAEAAKNAESKTAGKYAEKIDDFVSAQLKEIETLVEEGEDTILDNPTHDYAIQERNQSVMARVGILKALKGRLIQIMEDLHRSV